MECSSCVAGLAEKSLDGTATGRRKCPDCVDYTTEVLRCIGDNVVWVQEIHGLTFGHSF